MKRSRYNLLPYFIDDEKSLATRQAYVKRCEKFFAGLKPSSLPVDKRASLKYNKNRKV